MSADDNQQVRVLPQSSGDLPSEQKPIVLNYKKWKKEFKRKTNEGKPKYSRGLKDVQNLEGDMVHLTQTGARALSKSIDSYEDGRRKSARKKKDGAIDDFIHNSAKATSTYMKETSNMPVDLADAVRRMAFGKRLRKGLRRASKRILIRPI